MKKLAVLILALSILLSVCSGVFAAETGLNLDFSGMSGDIAHGSALKYNNKNIISFHRNTADGCNNSIGTGGPYGNYYKSVATGKDLSNVIYTFPGKDFADRTTKFVAISYVIRNTNTNRMRSNLRPAGPASSGSTTFYEWENNVLKPFSQNRAAGDAYNITMSPDKYYHFTILVDCRNTKWHFFVDGKYCGEYTLFTNLDWTGGFYYLTIQNYGAEGQPGEIHFDEYKVTFLDGEGVDVLPFADILEDDLLVDSFTADASSRKLQLHIVNNGTENKSLMMGNEVTTVTDGFSYTEGYKLVKDTLTPGYNTVVLNSPMLPAAGQTGTLYLWDSIFNMNPYGIFELNEKVTLKGE